jgi:hypothetical protein
MLRDETVFLEASVEDTVPPDQKIAWSPRMVLEVEMSGRPPSLKGSVEM